MDKLIDWRDNQVGFFIFKYVASTLVVMGIVIMVIHGCNILDNEPQIIVDEPQIEEEWPTSGEIKTGCMTLADHFTAEYQTSTNKGDYSYWVYDYPNHFNYFPKCDDKFHEWNEVMIDTPNIVLGVMNPSNIENRVGNVNFTVSSYSLGDSCFNVWFTQHHDNWNGIDDEEAGCIDNGVWGNWEQFTNTDTAYIKNMVDTTYWLFKVN